MYSDAFDPHDHRAAPRRADLQPARWHRRALGIALLGLLVVMHSCG